MDRELTILAGMMNTSQAKNTRCQTKTCYEEYGVGSHLNACKCCKNKGDTTSGPTISLEAPISPESFTSLFRQSFELVQLEPHFDASVNEPDGSGYAFRYPDVLLDRLGHFQIHRVGHIMVDSRTTTGFRMQRLRDFGVNVCKGVGLEGGG